MKADRFKEFMRGVRMGMDPCGAFRPIRRLETTDPLLCADNLDKLAELLLEVSQSAEDSTALNAVLDELDADQVKALVAKLTENDVFVALLHDWYAVGADLRRSIEKYRRETRLEGPVTHAQ